MFFKIKQEIGFRNDIRIHKHTFTKKIQLLDSFTKPKMKKENEHLHEYNNSSCSDEIENVKSSKITFVSFEYNLEKHERTLV